MAVDYGRAGGCWLLRVWAGVWCGVRLADLRQIKNIKKLTNDSIKSKVTNDNFSIP